MLDSSEIVERGRRLLSLPRGATATAPAPDVFPGERVTAETISFIQRTLEQRGTVRGLSDPSLRTIRVAVEQKI